MEFWSVQRSRCAESAFRLAPRRGPTLVVPFPSQRFSRSQGLGPPRPCDHFQAADARRILTFRALLLASTTTGSSPGLPSSTFSRTRRRAVASRACRVRCVPEGLSLPRSLRRTSSLLQAERGDVLSGSFRRLPKQAPGLRGFPVTGFGSLRSPPSLVFRGAPSKLAVRWTFDVFPPVPWRCSP